MNRLGSVERGYSKSSGSKQSKNPTQAVIFCKNDLNRWRGWELVRSQRTLLVEKANKSNLDTITPANF
jgi:hypothetical protein